MAAVTVTAPGEAAPRVYVGLYVPEAVRLPAHIGGSMEIATEYPANGDTATVTVEGLSRGSVLMLRCPGFSRGGCRVSSGGGAAPGAFAEVAVAAGARAAVTIDFDLEPYVVAGQATGNAVAVYRGPLLFSLPLRANVTVLERYAFGARDLSLATDDEWSKMLVLPPAAAARAARAGDEQERIFLEGVRALTSGGGACGVALALPAAAAAGWNATGSGESVDRLPTSPVPRGCAPEANVTLVPYACTQLRISAFPWTSPEARPGGVCGGGKLLDS